MVKTISFYRTRSISFSCHFAMLLAALYLLVATVEGLSKSRWQRVPVGDVQPEGWLKLQMTLSLRCGERKKGVTTVNLVPCCWSPPILICSVVLQMFFMLLVFCWPILSSLISPQKSKHTQDIIGFNESKDGETRGLTLCFLFKIYR